MGRKVFISFLGTNNYVPCNYFIEKDATQKVSNIKYVQEAIIKLFCSDFTQNDVIFTFTTSLAYQMNYLDDGQWNNNSKQYDLPNIGLQTVYKNILGDSNNPQYQSLPIKEGFSEKEIWEIFETVSNVIENGDELILDITHAFRFLPMLGVTLIDFLKVTKNVSVKGVFYGAFEKLGVQAKVLSMPIEERNAPIINLLPLIELQRWTQAANNFNQYGFADSIFELTNENIKPVLAQTQGKDELSKSLKSLGSILNTLIGNIFTNRGKGLKEFDATNLNTIIATIESSDLFIKPLKPLFQIIKNKVTPLIQTKYVWLESSKWCYKHNLIQQGITQLQEGIITYLLDQLKTTYNDSFYNCYEEKPRTLISSILNIIHKQTPETEWNSMLKKEKDRVYLLMTNPLITQFVSLFAKITSSRNDIQHAGYLKNAGDSKTFKDNLFSYIKNTEEIIYAPQSHQSP
ncbi:TIGR02221 family CRISPR-associated protein [Cellulophaga sp. BC115SP]|uniref:TIGR02221 family CRISPR-associated protein n=1 Tax=Cellulophaga sp. BC115SP TaxID=2683263 RepID=UPI001412D40D|nr:TIGR02221 family CRISPR-associated protein [Cellulophaga sp. BC115SP]NBB31242.1 TIGR02221 family CRISPR-associated protein [Cellulophaga sp. BC115SP]